MQHFCLCLILFPAICQAADFADTSELEKRVSTVEARLDLVERDLEKLTGQSAKACPCPDGPCICDKDCKCPDCPVHRTKGSGVKLLGFKTSWCAHCPGAEADCEGLAIEWVDADSDPRAKQYHVTAYPTLIRLVDGEKDGHFEGRTGMASQARKWLGKPSAKTVDKLHSTKKPVQDSRVEKPTRTVHADDGDASDDQIRQHLVDAHGYSWGQVQGMNRIQLKAAHNAGHGGPAVVARNYPVKRYSQPTIRYAQPAQYRPTTYYQPTYYRSYGYCPDCR